MSGSLDVTMSVSRLHDAATSGTQHSFNVGYPTPAEAESLVVTLLANVMEALGLDTEEYDLSSIPVLRMDVLADFSPPAIGPVLKFFRRRPGVHRKQDRSSRYVLEEDYSISHPRSCPTREHSDTYGTEPTRIYHREPCLRKRVNKASRRRHVRDEQWDRLQDTVDGVIRIEAEHGKERLGGCPRLKHFGPRNVVWHSRRDTAFRVTLNDAFEPELWAAILGERLLEFGLGRDQKLRIAPDWFSVIREVTANGIRFNKAARYATIVLAGPEQARAVGLKEWKRIRREVEERIGQVYVVDDELDPNLRVDLVPGLWQALDRLRRQSRPDVLEAHPGLLQLLDEEGTAEPDGGDADDFESEFEDLEDDVAPGSRSGPEGWLSIEELVRAGESTPVDASDGLPEGAED